MNTMLFPEDVANVIQSFYLCNKGDEATTDLLLTVGAELLDISSDKMLEMITEGPSRRKAKTAASTFPFIAASSKLPCSMPELSPFLWTRSATV